MVFITSNFKYPEIPNGLTAWHLGGRCGWGWGEKMAHLILFVKLFLEIS